MTKLFVAAPAHDGRLCVQMVQALIDEQPTVFAAGHEMRVSFLPGCSLITHARNQCCADFLSTDCDKLVFVDSDVSWERGSLLKLASQPVELVGGAYRYKSEPEAYPVTWVEDGAELWADPETGLLEVATLPGGFLCIARSVLERLAEAFPDRAYQHSGHFYQGFFHAPIGGGKMYGEDAAFCADWRSIGGKIWLDTELSLTHHGAKSFPGHVGNFLRSR